jgi:hypothetical protein
MRKHLAIVASVLSLALLAPMSAQGVEYGQDATGDPNAVWVMGSSGFLYSDRIVFTAAHVIEYFGDDFVNPSYLFAPGVKKWTKQKRYFIKKFLRRQHIEHALALTTQELMILRS